MATKIMMPQLGESVTEGTISRWLKKEGEWVKKDESLVEIITDKVTAEMPSPFAGVLSKIAAQEGTVIPVGQEIAEIEESGSAATGTQAATTTATTAAATAASAPTASTSAAAAAIQEANEVVAAAGKRSSPLVRRLAQEHGVDLSKIEGTGLAGRVTKDDILNFIAQKQEVPTVAAPPPVSAAPAQPRAPEPSIPTAPRPMEVPTAAAQAAPRPAPAPPPVTIGEGDQVIELTPMRRLIAEHMVRSKHTSPHATTMHEVDMTNIVKWREGVKDEFQRREGVPLSFVPFVIKATVEALKAFPIMNSSWADDKIVLRRQINIGMAVAIDDGLIVPVIHNADDKSIAGLAKAVNDLANRARAGKLTLDDIQGGTFTVNNVGTFGSIVSVPIINQPQAAILSMEAVVKRPVVIDDNIAIRSMMYLCLSFDHRIIDGYTAGKFVQRVRQWLEGFGPSVPLY